MYVGMAAAAARAEQLDAIADNLANAETPGYKATRPAFQSVRTTDNPLDIIPGDDSFLSVSTLNGGVAYTRNGKLNLTPEGMLVVDHHPVLGETGKPIMVPPGANLTINQAGVVSADGRAVDTLATFNLSGNIVRVGPQLYGPGPGGSVAPAEGGVSTGQLEMGNVTPLESTVQMINAQRHYEMATQAIQTYRRLDDRAIEVGKIR